MYTYSISMYIPWNPKRETADLQRILVQLNFNLLQLDFVKQD